jgi:hypothetical protein
VSWDEREREAKDRAWVDKVRSSAVLESDDPDLVDATRDLRRRPLDIGRACQWDAAVREAKQAALVAALATAGCSSPATFAGLADDRVTINDDGRLQGAAEVIAGLRAEYARTF